MPSLLSPSSSHTFKAYAPLADEVNPPFGNTAPAPTVTRNGTIVYGKRVSSNSSSHSSDDGTARFDTYHQTASEETLSPSGSQKGKARAINGYAQPVLQEGEADLGELRRSGGTIRAKGKEKAWDEEMGDQKEILDQYDGDAENKGSYPPMSGEEEEERVIQDHLARMAARDMARRRAARVSRQLSSPTVPSSPTSSSTTSSFMRRPFSLISSTSASDGKRNSIMGLMEGIIGSPKNKDERWMEGESSMSSSLPTTRPNTDQYRNPYDPQSSPYPTPRMVVSPTSPTQPSPFADPRPASSNTADNSARRASLASSHGITTSPLQSPTEGEGFSYGYAGAGWRGGAATSTPQAQQADVPRAGEKWWHALCAWGSDLDGGHDAVDDGGQGGRTNPFE